MENNRRQFLTGMGTAAAAAFSAPALLPNSATAGPIEPTLERGLTSKRNLYLQIETDPGGRLLSAEGGTPQAEVIEGPVDTEGVVPKQLGPVFYNELELAFATGARPPLIKLINSYL